MGARLPRRVIRDWHPGSAQPEEDWLADQYDQGWVPDPLYGGGPATVSIDDQAPVHRWAMVELPEEPDEPAASW